MKTLFFLVFLQLHLYSNIVTESSYALKAVYLRIPVFCDVTLRRWVPVVSEKTLAFIFKVKWSISTMDHLPLKVKEMCSSNSQESLTQRSTITFRKTAIPFSIHLHYIVPRSIPLCVITISTKEYSLA
jgi:hypothetical protein